MEPKKADQPAPDAGESNQRPRQDWQEPLSPAAPPGALGHSGSENDAAAAGAADEVEVLGKPPSPATADDELQRRGRQLEEVEGLTDNKAGG
jgi:hypothetical protein